MPARLCQQWRIQGRGPGDPPPPHPIFRPNWDLGPRGRKIFLDTAPPPLSQGLDDWGFPLSQGLDDWGFPLSQGPDDRTPSYFRLNDRPPPLISGWMTGSPPYLKVWIHHWSRSSTLVFILCKGHEKVYEFEKFLQDKTTFSQFSVKEFYFNPFYELYIFYKFFCLLVWASEEERVDAWA